jgi:lipopolysaccharide/colanic/teichoic acid biosynthesis glycosyltransferase
MNHNIQLGVKRALDIVASAMAILVLWPLLVLIAILIKLESPGPVFFLQPRAGYRGERFRMRKFRTMVPNAEASGSGYYVGRDDARVTRVGKMLRRFSLDELPQLLQIFTGKMSVVGPRPGLPYHVEHYNPDQMRRLDVRPGLTGWSQVNGRNQISWPERIEKDVWYVDHFSLWLDAKIILRTFGVLLSGEGLYGARENFFFSGQDDVPVPTRRDS